MKGLAHLFSSRNRIPLQRLSATILISVVCQVGFAQMAPPPTDLSAGEPPAPSFVSPPPATAPAAEPVPPAVRQLLGFRESDVKFSLSDLMDVLRDRRHEGWVLAAYPDPKTGHPLIGAGFSLDLPQRDHPQRDPLNPHLFIEPSSAALWQAAGLNPEKLENILRQYNDNLARWRTSRYRREIPLLEPQITEDEATALLRIAVVQSVENAMAYCRNFDQLSASQQMALSQLVYQMGVNLEEFDQFLTLLNGQPSSPSGGLAPATDAAYWHTVQASLIQSQWARLYRVRAISVIAMLDPRYPDDPSIAERRIAAVLHPAVSHRRRHGPAARLQVASWNGRSGHGLRRRSTRARNRRRV